MSFAQTPLDYIDRSVEGDRLTASRQEAGKPQQALAFIDEAIRSQHMATTDYAEKVSAILSRIGGELIEATPEWWSEATLRVKVNKLAEGTSISHSIHSDKHPKDVVVATDSILSSTRELQLLSENAGESWSAFVMLVRQEGDDWKFSINFEYGA